MVSPLLADFVLADDHVESGHLWQVPRSRGSGVGDLCLSKLRWAGHLFLVFLGNRIWLRTSIRSPLLKQILKQASLIRTGFFHVSPFPLAALHPLASDASDALGIRTTFKLLTI